MSMNVFEECPIKGREVVITSGSMAGKTFEVEDWARNVMAKGYVGAERAQRGARRLPRQRGQHHGEGRFLLMDVIRILTSVAIFAAGCALAYRAGYTNGATAMYLYYKSKEGEK